MIKEIKTERFEGLAVLVPKGTLDNPPYITWLTPTAGIGNQWLGWTFKHGVELPQGSWEIIGKATELTEEQCAEIVDVAGFFDFGFGRYKSYSENDKSVIFAGQSFESLMKSLECYSVNPLPDPEDTMRQGNGYVYYGATDEEFEEYERIQSRTGSWIILKKI